MDLDPTEDVPEESVPTFRKPYWRRHCCVVQCHNNSYRDIPRGHKIPQISQGTKEKKALGLLFCTKDSSREARIPLAAKRR